MKPPVAWSGSFWAEPDPSCFQGRKITATVLQSKRGQNRLEREGQEFYTTFKKQIQNKQHYTFNLEKKEIKWRPKYIFPGT